MTAQPPTHRGILTDKEGPGFPGCRIQIEGEQQDRPFTVRDFVQKYLDAIPKKARVCFQSTDGKLSKIWEDKGQGNTEKCTSPENPAPKSPASPPAAPASGLKIVEGQITAIDHGAHALTVKDRAGQAHVFIWAAPMDDRMAKLKQWWFVKVTAEQSGEYWKVVNQEFFKKPDDWPQSSHGGGSGGRPQAPRNERIIVLQTCYKEAAETARQMLIISDQKFDEKQADAVMDWVLARAKKDAAELCREAGVP